jgi:RimJ/RimL family protein N-acetyltransferase
LKEKDALSTQCAGDPMTIFSEIKRLIELTQYKKAYETLCLLREQTQQGQTLSPTERQLLRQQLWQLSPMWWTPIQHGSVLLRRCTASDAAFFSQCYADAQFTQAFNRQPGWKGNLSKVLNKFGHAPPAILGTLQWIICVQGTPVGLASLSSIDARNSRAEFSIGLPGVPPAGVAHKVSLLVMHFAFFTAGLNKIYAYVYEDNQKAHHDTKRLGFMHEGRLYDHYFLPPEGFVTVDTFGLTKAQALQNMHLVKIVRRCINQQW